MPRLAFTDRSRRKLRPSSFTLVEMLTVLAIIGILAAVLLAAASGVMNEAKYSRARAEIAGISSALENYKTDNGAYPTASGLTGGTNGAYPLDPINANATVYQTASQALFTALNGQQSSLNSPATNSTYRVYYVFKANQVGNPTGTTYVQDPWANSYGYSTGDGTANNVPVNGSGFYDLWSTAGSTTSTNKWVTNWK